MRRGVFAVSLGTESLVQLACAANSVCGGHTEKPFRRDCGEPQGDAKPIRVQCKQQHRNASSRRPALPPPPQRKPIHDRAPVALARSTRMIGTMASQDMTVPATNKSRSPGREKKSKKTRSKSIGPGGMDALKDDNDAANRRKVPLDPSVSFNCLSGIALTQCSLVGLHPTIYPTVQRGRTEAPGSTPQIPCQSPRLICTGSHLTHLGCH
jgi:hypothetical protein